MAHLFRWDGRGDNGFVVPDGHYLHPGSEALRGTAELDQLGASKAIVDTDGEPWESC